MKTASGQCWRVGFQQVQRAVRVDGEVETRIARGPVVRGLGGGVDDEGDGLAVARENGLE